MSRIDCSIIIPAYNAEKTILRCLQSIELDNIYDIEIEVIIINDGSIDNTRNIINKYAQNHLNIKLFNKANGGVSSARNLGIRKAVGQYIFFCDCDDQLIRGTLNEMVKIAKEKNADVVMARYEKTYEIKEKIEDSCHKNDNINLPCNVLLNRDFIVNRIISSFVTGNGYATTCNKLYKRDIIFQYGLHFDENCTHGEDRTFNIDFFDVASSLIVVKEVVYRYFIDGSQGDTRKYSKKLENSLIVRYKKTVALNYKYNFYNKRSKEMLKMNKDFICLCINFLELDNKSNGDKKRFLKNKEVKNAINILLNIRKGELPGWNRKNHFAMLLLKLKLYKLLILLHYKFKIRIIPS